MAVKSPDIEPTPSPTPPPYPAETHVAPHPITGEPIVMAGPAPPPIAEAPSPVAVATRKVVGPTSMVLPRVNTRASHFYFKRVFQQLRSIGQYRR